MHEGMSKLKVLLMVLALIVLILTAYSTYSLKLDVSNFTPDSYYRGTSDSKRIDPKEYYNNLYGTVTDEESETACKTEVVQAKNSTPIGSLCVMPVDRAMTATELSNLSNLIGMDCRGLFKDGDKLVMPITNDGFRNSNIVDNTSGGTTKDIEFFVGDKYVLKFVDVKCWWCHNHNPTITTHTDIVGNASSSSYTKVGMGSIVGMANATTTLQVWMLSDQNDPETINKDEDAKFVQVSAYTLLVENNETTLP